MKNKAIVEFKDPTVNRQRTYIDVDMFRSGITEGFATIFHYDEVGNKVMDLFNVDEIHSIRFVEYKGEEDV